jgi:circadian clock protein KaiC
VDAGAVQLLYLSRAHLRGGQFLTILADRLVAMRATRVVLDAATHIIAEGAPPEELRGLLYSLVVRFKTLGVTSLLTLEAASLYSGETVTERALSPIADNLLMLRYAIRGERLEPTITVIKTRGSDHDRATYPLTIARGGVRVASHADGEPPSRGG